MSTPASNGPVDRLVSRLDAETRLAVAEERRGVGIVVATMRRFFAIEGVDLAGLVALELFLTVIPITILGFVMMVPQRADVSIGRLYVRQLHLSGDNAQLVMQTFGDSSLLRSAFGNFWGALGFLVWGVPMSLTVAKVFARAWRQPEPAVLTRLWRGACWFVLYLLARFFGDVVEIATRHLVPNRFAGWVLGMLVGVLPLVVLWAASHPLLVPGARWRWRTMAVIGLVGALITGPLSRLAETALFPTLMSWWTGFGPLGVAMTLLTWSMVEGGGWVVAACLGAVIVERRRDEATPGVSG